MIKTPLLRGFFYVKFIKIFIYVLFVTVQLIEYQKGIAL